MKSNYGKALSWKLKMIADAALVVYPNGDLFTYTSPVRMICFFPQLESFRFKYISIKNFDLPH